MAYLLGFLFAALVIAAVMLSGRLGNREDGSDFKTED